MRLDQFIEGVCKGKITLPATFKGEINLQPSEPSVVVNKVNVPRADQHGEVGRLVFTTDRKSFSLFPTYSATEGELWSGLDPVAVSKMVREAAKP